MSSDLRQRVIDAATQSFSMFGYKATTMEQVARIAGVGKGTIYTFFASKEELLSHILNTLTLEMRQVAETSVHAKGSLFDNLQRALSGILQFRQQQELLVKLSQELREYGTAVVQEGLQKMEEAIIRYIAMEIDKGIQSGDVRPCASELIAFIMFKTYTALVVDWGRQHDSLQDADIAQVFQQVFAEGLDARSTSGTSGYSEKKVDRL